MKARDIGERFLKKVDKTESCWNWTGAKDASGYGRFSFQGKNQTAHRISFLLAHGQSPAGMVLHSCDNRACVNPSHLREGTAKDNTADMFSRSRDWQSKKTHCPQGHEYSVANTYVHGSRRTCRKCKNG